MQKVKVSVVEPIGGHGGLEFYDFGLCEAIHKKGFDVTLYTSDETILQKIVLPDWNISIVFKEIFGKGNKFLRGLKYLKGVVNTLTDSKKRGAEIAHFHIFHFSYLEFFNLWLFRLFGFSVVITVHDIKPLDKLSKDQGVKKYKKFSKIATHMVVHNSFTKREVVRRMPLFNPNNIHIVPSTDLDFYFKKDISREESLKTLEIDIPKSSKVILFFGQIKKTKGLDILLNALKEMKKENFYLLVAGRPWKTDMKEYKRIISENNLDNKTILHLKYIRNEDVPIYFKASDIVVLPYIIVYNSSVLLRAMDYGTVPIVSNLDVFTEIIEDGYNGLVFKTEDWNDLKNVILKVIKDDILRKKIRKNIRKFVDTNFSLDITGKKMAEIYTRILK